MNQRSLFEPENVARSSLQDAISRLDFATASRLLEEFLQLWPAAEPGWEPALIRIGSDLATRHLDLDAGWKIWERVKKQLDLLDVPPPIENSLRRHFFSRLLAANRRLFEELRTPAGRSLAEFYLLAEQPGNARRRCEQEIRQLGEGWMQRLHLGNCDFRLGHEKAAHSNYHWAFLLGLPVEEMQSIEDRDFLVHLQSAEDPEWAFAEACVTGDLPAARFSTRDAFEEFKTRIMPLTDSTPPRRFSLCWIVSENRPFCENSELLQARREMKSLHSGLHLRYMQRLP